MPRSLSTLVQALGTPLVRQHTLQETGVSIALDDPSPASVQLFGAEEVIIWDCFGQWDALTQLVNTYWELHGKTDRDLRGLLEALHRMRDLLHCMAITAGPASGTEGADPSCSMITVCATHANILEVDQD
jgi:hypothetical protein